ncbi:N-acetyl-D-Glu racemase DgcA [Oceanicella actignis]|uniref:Dipeptide epimerase n=1 Tax=Oceanicella actignis TaxID=1189325 RepID=A0A1M7SEA3_9RHOB|nr:N-acetyl-D-Glu racemase DgcA [Oceanicella actignis]SET23656.1 L-alanine-DL-glutamate epimerase [Oceanicella actignis]SHN56809.1 L-alanine-DL-glutamate epimerase [Oceanicella actignis]
MIRLDLRREAFRLREAFTISRGSRTEQVVVTVTLTEGERRGWAECTPYARYGESVAGVMDAISALAADIANGMDRAALQAALPPGAARNALDCALWDLEAKRAGRRAWELAGLPEPEPVATAYTLSLDAPERMRRKAAENAGRPLLKVKLGGEGDLERLRAVREGAPEATIIVDANEGWSAETYAELAPEMLRLGVAMVEQPLPAGQDEALAEIARPLPVCADESCHDRASLDALTGRYDMVNIKLDKTGGLTEALALRDEATARGLGVMVGCMMGTSLAMAPATLVAQGARIVDLDGPLLLARDREPPLTYDAAGLHPPPAALWG